MNDPHVALRAYLGQTICSSSGATLGHIDDVLGDVRSRAAQWVVVRLRGPLPRHRAIPLTLLLETRHGLVVPASPTAVRSSPPVRARSDLSARQEQELQRYWTEQ